MKERPIIFSAPMVLALLGNAKRQTRRIVKPRTLAHVQSIARLHDLQQARTEDLAQAWVAGKFQVSAARHPEGGSVAVPCPYGRPGDRLWVKETWRDEDALSNDPTVRRVIYRADEIGSSGSPEGNTTGMRVDVRWRSSLFMPRRASRILLNVVAIRIERLQDISVADAVAEGIPAAQDNLSGDDPIRSYRTLFETINGPGAWEANPWVWVVDFEPVDADARTRLISLSQASPF